MNRRETALFALAASGLAALLFSEVLRGRVLYFQDFGGAFEPLRHALGAAFRSGKLPLWNDLISNGQTFVGNPFAEVTYAPNLIFAVDASPARLLSLLTALHVAWAMLGACVLARTLGGSRTGSLVAGALFGAGGAFVSATYMTTLVNTASWIPWLCAFHVKNEDDTDAEKGWRTPLALAAIAIMAVTAGDPTMLLAGALGTLVLSRSPRSFLKTARVYAVTFLLMTPLLGLWARNAADTDRGAGLARSEALSRSLPPLELLGVMAPHFFGDGPLSRDELVTPGSADGNGLRLFPGLYVGALGVALVIAGVGVRRSSEEEFGDEAPVETRSRLGLRLAIWAVSLLLLSLGP